MFVPLASLSKPSKVLISPHREREVGPDSAMNAIVHTNQDDTVPRLLSHPLFSIVAFEISLVVLFAIPNHQHRNRVVLCLLCAIAVVSIYAAPLAGDSNFARLWIFAWVLWLATFTNFVGTAVPPESRYWRHSHGFREAEDLRPLGPHKIAWSASLVHNLRGVGWNWQINGIIPPKESRRLRFVLGKGFQTAALLLVSNTLQQAMLRLYHDTSYPTQRPHDKSPRMVARLRQQSHFRRIRLGYNPTELRCTLNSGCGLLLEHP